MNIGVLALQGDFREHRAMLEACGADVSEVRLSADLEGLSGLVVPGGESSTIGMLARENGLEEAVRAGFQSGELAIWGTCAGTIWLAKDLPKNPDQPRAGLMNISVQRNAYGRQIDSFEEFVKVKGLEENFDVFFIRAPIIESVSKDVEILAMVGDRPVLIRQGKLMASTFHPELGKDKRLHQLFIDTCVLSKN